MYIFWLHVSENNSLFDCRNNSKAMKNEVLIAYVQNKLFKKKWPIIVKPSINGENLFDSDICMLSLVSKIWSEGVAKTWGHCRILLGWKEIEMNFHVT